MGRQLKLVKFGDLDLTDPFFNSLKAGYSSNFVSWFQGKSSESLYIVEDGIVLSGMIYLKQETGIISDVNPPLPNRNWLKVGTFKIERRGTKLGERVIKKIFDTAINQGADGIYMTVFEVHASLIRLFKRYGFRDCGTKTTLNGVERVLVRDLRQLTDDIIKDYPFVHKTNRRHWLLCIWPQFHTRLLPDSILKNESTEIVQDVSHTNTIHKIYIAHVSFSRMRRGDTIIFYRTADRSPARYRSVVTSICVVEEVKTRADFKTLDAFLTYCRPHSVYSEEELTAEYQGSQTLSIAKMTYNAAFGKRTTRGVLIDDVGIRESYWSLLEITAQQFDEILELGQVNARLVVH